MPLKLIIAYMKKFLWVFFPVILVYKKNPPTGYISFDRKFYNVPLHLLKFHWLKSFIFKLKTSNTVLFNLFVLRYNRKKNTYPRTTPIIQMNIRKFNIHIYSRCSISFTFYIQTMNILVSNSKSPHDSRTVLYSVHH